METRANLITTCPKDTYVTDTYEYLLPSYTIKNQSKFITSLKCGKFNLPCILQKNNYILKFGLRI